MEQVNVDLVEFGEILDHPELLRALL